VEIVNPDGGPLRVLELEVPNARQFGRRRNITGEFVSYDYSRGTTRRSGLTYDTPVEARGVVRPLREWIQHMDRHSIDHLRCEAPFRESQSEAAFIGRTSGGHYFIFDSGLSTSFFIGDDERMVEAERNMRTLARLSDIPSGNEAPQADLVGAHLRRMKLTRVTRTPRAIGQALRHVSRFPIRRAAPNKVVGSL
jgi:hypothetical protein